MHSALHMSKINDQRWLGFFFIWLLTLSACRKDNAIPDYPAGSDKYINSWILDSMKVYYYWNKTLPSKPDINQQPLNFFASIKNSGDRFSRLTNPSFPESYYPSLVHNFGFDLVVFQESSGTIKTVVALVVPGTKANTIGLERGDVIKGINGIIPSGSNIAGLVASSIGQRSIILEVEEKGELFLGAELVTENPLYLYKTFVNSGKPVAYLFYNSFEGRSKYDLQAAFTSFKAANSTELIIDLRYNPGGDIGVCAALAAAVSSVERNDIFVEYRGNSNAGIRRESFENTISKISPGYSFSFDELKAMRLPLNRVFILTGNHTASAAEFLIKGLKPWINVIHIGATTLGKDMASFAIQDSNTAKKNNWSIEPVIFKLYNSNGEGDYPFGLVPDIQVNEFTGPLVVFGDINDPLIKSAMANINGMSQAKSANAHPGRLLYDSRSTIDKNAAQVKIKRFP